jgi:malate dehydrogenase
MFSRAISHNAGLARQFSSTSAVQSTVAVCGAAGGIGQPMSLLLKDSDLVSDLRLFDVVNTPGVAADLGHCSSPAKVSGHTGMEEAAGALSGCDVVVIPAGVPRKPGMTRDDLFNTNAGIVMGLANACADHCPDAAFCIISNPVNSTVPIFAETLKAKGVYNPKKLFGVTTLDVVRARTFVSENQGWNPRDTDVTVIGGHAGTTILPLLSQIANANFSEDDIAALSHRIQFGGDEVVQAKDGAGSATLSMAYAGAEFAVKLIRALNGEAGITECTYVESDVTDAQFFSSPVTLGKDGVGEIHGFGALSAFEQENFDSMLPDLQAQIAKGVKFVAENQ